MSYRNWQEVFPDVERDEPRRFAQRWNLENEYRINQHRGQFKRMIGRRFRTLNTADAPKPAAIEALDRAVAETRPVNSRWLGLLRLVDPSTLPKPLVTHVPMTLVEIARFRTRAYVHPTRPLKRVKLTQPLKTYTTADGSPQPHTRFVWFTFEDGTVLPNDPTTLSKELGLGYIRPSPASFLYRCTLDARTDHLYIPTCLDAGLYEGWAPPPLNHSLSWGLTRHLETGKPSWPELLGETVDYLADKPVATLVSPPGESARAVRELRPDYRTGREGVSYKRSRDRHDTR